MSTVAILAIIAIPLAIALMVASRSTEKTQVFETLQITAVALCLLVFLTKGCGEMNTNNAAEDKLLHETKAKEADAKIKCFDQKGRWVKKTVPGTSSYYTTCEF